MRDSATEQIVIEQPEPRWHAILAVAAVGGMFAALPHDLIVEPRWLFPAAVFALLIPTVITHTKRYYKLNKLLGFALSCLLTVGMIVSVVQLVRALPSKAETAEQLLISAGVLWFTNVIIFALWYWRLDAGGPQKREKRFGHPTGAFLFPQMTVKGEESWSPNFIDYLFVAFNTSTAFSPTDVPVLDRWAKVLMMIQSVISLAVIALLAARAINTLA